jgi:hypothetical protein
MTACPEFATLADSGHYTFARVSAATEMNVEDYYRQGKRWWVRLHEKGGKQHESFNLKDDISSFKPGRFVPRERLLMGHQRNHEDRRPFQC